MNFVQIYGPCDEQGRKLGFFPGIVDAVSKSGVETMRGEEEEAAAATAIQHQIWRTARAIQRAADALRGQLFFP